MIQRRQVLLIAFTLFAIPLAVQAQQISKLRRVGVIWPVAVPAAYESFRQAMRKLGYVEGRTCQFAIATWLNPHQCPHIKTGIPAATFPGP